MSVHNPDIKLIVRVPAINQGLISRVLEWGASGIMVPHVSDVQIAEECVRAVNYPPDGCRGYSSQSRHLKYGLQSQTDTKSVKKTYLLVQIENYKGVINSQAISQVEGVDVLFIGTSDLKLDLSSRKEPCDISLDDAVNIVLAAVQKTNKQAGIIIKEPEETENYLRKGFTCLGFSSDLTMIRTGYQSVIKKINNLK